MPFQKSQGRRISASISGKIIAPPYAKPPRQRRNVTAGRGRTKDHVHDAVHLVGQRLAHERRGLHRSGGDTVRGERTRIVRGRMRYEAHRDEDDAGYRQLSSRRIRAGEGQCSREVDPDGAVREPAVRLERADLADDHADESPDDDAHCEAELPADKISTLSRAGKVDVRGPW